MSSEEFAEQAADDGFDLAFVLLAEPVMPDPQRVIDAAATSGIALHFDPSVTEDQDGEIHFYDGPEGRLLVVMMQSAPHPDAREMAYGISSPDPEAAAAAPAHLILTIVADGTDVRARDAKAAQLTAAVVRSTQVVGAMLGHGKVFHQPELFQEMDPGCSAGSLPAELCIDLSVGKESETELSILTHGMPRYGREEIAVFAPIADPNEAFDFAMTMVTWLLGDPSLSLPTGDTVGREPEEQVRVERGPSPIDPEQTILRLRMA